MTALVGFYVVNRGGDKVTPFLMPMELPNMAAAQVSLQFGLRGYNSTVITACAASSQSIGEAVEVIVDAGESPGGEAST